MDSNSLNQWVHGHSFLGKDHERNERRTWLVVAITAAMMVAEIVAGSVYGSLALLADGWHMATHAAAIGIAAFAYRFARARAEDRRFTFGTGKVGELAAFASAIILGLVALLIAFEALQRLFSPVAIRFGEAITVAVIGLAVNLLCAWLLLDRGKHNHAHHSHHHYRHHDGRRHHEHARDLNLRAAYLHVLADALTSILAIAALLIGATMGWLWLDPVIGIVGAAVIANWAIGLIRASARVLLDAVPDSDVEKAVRAEIEDRSTRIADFHYWQVGPGHYAAIVSIVSGEPRTPDEYRQRINAVTDLSHLTVEVTKLPRSNQIAA